MRFTQTISLFIVFGLSMGHLPMMCLSEPPVSLEAGVSELSARIYNPLPRRCLASIAFDNEDFLPVSYAFESGRCDGPELASFLVPLDAPNGDAYVAWQCAGQSPSCSRVVISGGQGNSSIEPLRNGTVSCIGQTLTTSTISTTITDSSTTAVKTFLSVFTSLTTSRLWTTSTVSNSGLPSVPTLLTTRMASESDSSSSSQTVLESDSSSSSQTMSESVSPTLAVTLPAPTVAQTSSVVAAVVQNVTGGVLGDEPIFTSAGSKSSPPRAAITLLSTLTVMQTMTALVTAACASS